MNSKPYKVAIVVNKDFGAELLSLYKRLHVWVCNSKANAPYIKQIWSESKENSIEIGVTKFDISEQDSAEKMFLGILHTVDEHHGEYSHNPPWSILEVYGISPTEKIKAELETFGQGRFEAIPHGFIFYRTL